jgi:hypothetical protein
MQIWHPSDFIRDIMRYTNLPCEPALITKQNALTRQPHPCFGGTKPSQNRCILAAKARYAGFFTKVSSMKHILLATALSSVLLASSAHAASGDFFDNLSGSWSGSGKAYLSKYGEISAKCRVAISGAETQVAMKGSCGMLVFQRALGLSIRNAGGNRYVGTYTGSKTGPAKLDGTLRGDRLVMNIKWGGLVNGDRTAQMVLRRTGPNSFAQTVNDEVDGKHRSTSHFAFVRH